MVSACSCPVRIGLDSSDYSSEVITYYMIWHLWLTTTNLSYRFSIFETSATASCGSTGRYIVMNAQQRHEFPAIFLIAKKNLLQPLSAKNPRNSQGHFSVSLHSASCLLDIVGSFLQSNRFPFWLVVSPPSKNISQIGNLPQIGVKIKNIRNHHLALLSDAVSSDLFHPGFRYFKSSPLLQWTFHELSVDASGNSGDHNHPGCF